MGGPQKTSAVASPQINVAIRGFANCGPNIFSDLRTQLFFADLTLPHIHHVSPYKNKLTMLSFKFKGELLAFGTVLRQSTWHFVIGGQSYFVH